MSTYDDASLIYYPSGYKASKAYSLKPTDGSGDLTFTRASTATRVNEQGLIEGVRTNLQIYSEDFRNIAEGGATNTWTPNDTIILSTNNTAPDGTLTATRIRGISGGNKARQAIIIGTSGAPYSGSIYIRRVSGTGTIQLRVGDVGTTSTINPTSTWQRFDHTVSPTTTTIRLALVLSNDTDEFEIWGAQLEQSASPTEYIPTTTTAVSVGITNNVPRIDYTGGGCGKLLLEPQRTNLALRSEEFDNAYWTKRNITINANSIVAPDGNITADELIDNATNFLHDVYFAPSGFIQNTFFTISAFVKPNTITACRLIASSVPNSNAAFASFNLLTQVTTASNSGNFSNATSKIELFTNGWYRVSLTFQTGATGTSWYADGCSLRLEKPYQTQIYSGTGEGIYAWGAQFEQGSYPTSYIPTTSTAVTRVVDASSTTFGYNLTNLGGGTVLLELDKIEKWVDNNEPIFNFYDGATRILILRGSNTDTRDIRFQDISGGGNLTSPIPLLATNNKIAISWDGTSSVKVSINGATITASPISSLFSTNRIDISTATDGKYNIGSLIVIDEIKSQAELNALTTL